ncbi:gliding motility-associated C-terminal domain-containing protein [Olleya namhaensis]|uniref:T9SS type B sorting domain-containing protein n=1 Tax=Olleya namhaensis TaxID=1144750 RepID=UPI00249159EB|nr:gliding motility-associated C-terminal domain-containing protein [Olleya namhaensis]
MELLLLKSSVCLLALLLFYKIALEPLSIHKFKRVYLLVAVAVAGIIPFITFVKYVQPAFDKSSFIFDTSTTIPLDTNFKIVEETNYLPIILYSIYALGVGLFFIRFCVNLYKIVSKIRKHTKVKSSSFINVLMEQLEIPHTFFNYIFLNKNKFENKQIPAEVLLHEQTHAKQKHSIDIIIIELLQVIFWFNPLLYWLKKEVKLNHEFLADQDVINQGVDTKTYQTILLQFSSNQQELALANAINYSSIKKRFTLMKTQTPKRTKWIRSVLLLPLLALLLYSFSSTKEVEKELTPAMLFQDEKEVNTRQNNLLNLIEDDLDKIGQLKINYLNQDTLLLVNGIACDGCTLNLSKKGIAELILSTTNQEDITNFKLKIPGIKTLFNEGNMPNNEARQYVLKTKKGDIIQLFDIKTKSNKFKPVIIKVVDKNDENYSESPKVKKGEESSIPPPPPTPPANPNATPEEKAKQEKVVSDYYKNNKVVNGKVLRNPPPPPPVSPSVHIAEMAQKNATFFHNGNPITAEEAKQVIKNNKEVNISSHTNNGVSTVIISSKPIETINGKQVKSNSNDCLSFNNTINFKQSNTTLKINCIENYPNNELKIFNRWGKMIYSKKGYNNSWNGKVDKEFTDNEDGTVTQGTYYYVLKTGTKEEPTAGPLYIIN